LEMREKLISHIS